jgi:hypothetical protein
MATIRKRGAKWQVQVRLLATRVAYHRLIESQRVDRHAPAHSVWHRHRCSSASALLFAFSKDWQR